MLEGLSNSGQDATDLTTKIDAKRTDLCQHLQQLGAWDEATAAERDLLQKKMNAITDREKIDASWRVEAAQVLMWALQLLETLPPYDSRIKADILKQIPTSQLLAPGAARLRDSREILKARGVAEFWHWRSRTRQIIERGDKFPDTPQMRSAGYRSFDDIVRTSAKKGAADGLFTAIDEDFPAKGKAYRDLTPPEWTEVRSITIERHFALNWLAGQAPANQWDKTPTGT